MQLSNSKIIPFLISTVASVFLSLPADAHRAAGVALWFFVLDLVSGLIAGRIRGRVTSRKLREGMRDKMICYGIIIGFAAGLSILVGRPEWYSFAVWGVIATEALSIIENLRTILRKMGKTVQPLSRFLDTVATWIEKVTGIKGDEATGDTVTEITVPAKDATGAETEVVPVGTTEVKVPIPAKESEEANGSTTDAA